MVIKIENVREWEKVCLKIVNSHMYKLAVKDEKKVVKLLSQVFQMGMALERDKFVEVEV